MVRFYFHSGEMPNSTPMYLEVEDIFALSAEQTSRRKSTSKEPLNYTNRAIMTFVEAVAKMNEAVLVPSKLRDIEVRESDSLTLMPINSDLYSFFQMLNNAHQDLFSSSNFQSAFMPAASANNSGQNSGRVTPTHSMSRRSSGIGMYGQLSVPASNGSLTNGTNGSRTLAPPSSLLFERKLSQHSLNGDSSPDLLAGTAPPPPPALLSPSSLSPLPLLSFNSRAASFNSLLAAVAGPDEGVEPSGSEERVQTITTCFMHHLTALYTILGHFTRGANYITRRYQEETEDNC